MTQEQVKKQNRQTHGLPQDNSSINDVSGQIDGASACAQDKYRADLHLAEPKAPVNDE
jgi:hypothetical protein